jgi:hypothetical protein
MADAAPLPADEALRLTEFARACKAAARAVLLYPSGHPAVGATLARLVDLTTPAAWPDPVRLQVLTDQITIEGRAPARPDSALRELAALLHDHLIGELVVYPGGDADAWRRFLLLVGRPADAVRAEGGIARVWTTLAGRHVELREIDYSEVLKERAAGRNASWDQVIANCLQGHAADLDEETVQALLQAAGDPEQLANLLGALDLQASEEAGRSGIGPKTAALMRLLQGIVDVVKGREPQRIDDAMRNVAEAFGRLSPDLMLALLAQAQSGTTATRGLAQAVVGKMSDATITAFVARNVMGDDAPIERVAHAFQALVRDDEGRERLLALAKDEAAHSPLGSTEGFEQVWDKVAQKLMTSYTDKPFVSDAYGRELSLARSRAIDIEQQHDDPPDRISAWLGTVGTNEVRKLDLTLLLDLLRIEPSTDRWSSLMRPVVGLLEDLILVGDFEDAEALLGALVEHTRPEAPTDRRQSALIALDVLVAGPLMRHIVTHLTTIDDAQFERVKRMCVSIGDVLIRALAEALVAEERPRPRERLTAILIGFGASGRREAERLKSSPNPAVRRTAIYLMREFGGTEALPELTELMDDNEPQVQREAVRAILNLGTDQAYYVLEQALTTGTARSRDMIMQSLVNRRDERAVPLFAHILQHIDHRGPLASIYIRAIEGLGGLRHADGVPPLKEALYRGEWWAPRRTAALREAAAAALARIGTPAATDVLREAAASGPRGVRAAARRHLPRERPAQSPSRDR